MKTDSRLLNYNKNIYLKDNVNLCINDNTALPMPLIRNKKTVALKQKPYRDLCTKKMCHGSILGIEIELN